MNNVVKQEICDFQGRGELLPNRNGGLQDLGNKFSSDGQNCLSLLEGKEEEKEVQEEEPGVPGLPGSNKGKEVESTLKEKEKVKVKKRKEKGN